MPAVVTQVDIFIAQGESEKRWFAWFSVLYSDNTIRSWDMVVPAEATWVAPGIPDHVWIATLLKVVTSREPKSEDIVVTSSGSGSLTVQLHGERIAQGDEATQQELWLAKADSNSSSGVHITGNVSRETNA